MCLISTSRNSAKRIRFIRQRLFLPLKQTNNSIKFSFHEASTNLFFDAEKLEIMTVSKFLVKVPALEPFQPCLEDMPWLGTKKQGCVWEIYSFRKLLLLAAAFSITWNASQDLVRLKPFPSHRFSMLHSLPYLPTSMVARHSGTLCLYLYKGPFFNEQRKRKQKKAKAICDLLVFVLLPSVSREMQVRIS